MLLELNIFGDMSKQEVNNKVTTLVTQIECAIAMLQLAAKVRIYDDAWYGFNVRFHMWNDSRIEVWHKLGHVDKLNPDIELPKILKLCNRWCSKSKTNPFDVNKQRHAPITNVEI
jgi:hypothetical protein